MPDRDPKVKLRWEQVPFGDRMLIECHLTGTFILRLWPDGERYRVQVIGQVIRHYWSKRTFTLEDAKAYAVKQGIAVARRLAKINLQIADVLRRAEHAE